MEIQMTFGIWKLDEDDYLVRALDRNNIDDVMKASKNVTHLTEIEIKKLYETSGAGPVLIQRALEDAEKKRITVPKEDCEHHG